jgi:hypothetical protein
MDSSVSRKDQIWFLCVCHHVSNAVYHVCLPQHFLQDVPLRAPSLQHSMLQRKENDFVATYVCAMGYWLYGIYGFCACRLNRPFAVSVLRAKGCWQYTYKPVCWKLYVWLFRINCLFTNCTVCMRCRLYWLCWLYGLFTLLAVYTERCLGFIRFLDSIGYWYIYGLLLYALVLLSAVWTWLY